jgi:hypothetical protein
MSQRQAASAHLNRQKYIEARSTTKRLSQKKLSFAPIPGRGNEPINQTGRGGGGRKPAQEVSPSTNPPVKTTNDDDMDIATSTTTSKELPKKISHQSNPRIRIPYGSSTMISFR